MSKDIKNLATSQLMTYQQIIGMANEQMDRYATDMEEFAKAGTVSQGFFQEIMREMGPKVQANNEVLTQIERELFGRAKRDFPTATLPSVMDRYMKRYHEEVASRKKDQKKEETPKGKEIKPNFKVEE